MLSAYFSREAVGAPVLLLHYKRINLVPHVGVEPTKPAF